MRIAVRTDSKLQQKQEIQQHSTIPRRKTISSRVFVRSQYPEEKLYGAFKKVYGDTHFR